MIPIHPVAVEVLLGLLGYMGMVLALWLLSKYLAYRFPWKPKPYCLYCGIQPKGSMCPDHGIVK
jgi:hypothetical protein